ncbi:RNA ligase/cyclic nucleotide phosphodiesterase [Aspergillus varians]
MAELVNLRGLFSFPPQQAGEPSTRNWYSDLLNHPDCESNPTKVQEAYEHFRSSSLARSISSCLPAQNNDSVDDSQKPTSFITPDVALIRYLDLQTQKGSSGPGTRHHEIEELSNQNANCLVIWARPDTRTLKLLVEIQSRLSSLVGPDLHVIPAADMHLSVIELSHRHSVSQLRSVYDKVGPSQLEKLLDVPRAEYNANKSTVRLVKPMIMFDKVGVAVGFVPAEDTYTHHHLRNQLHTMTLATGVSIDTCYTAPLAHVTVGRFVDNAFFEAADQGGAIEVRRNRMERWVSIIQQINEDLQREHWGNPAWVVGGEKALEVQLGYVKFGRQVEKADLVGYTLETRP